jgi:uncharacterized protein YndB with AHSA1/START domain
MDRYQIEKSIEIHAPISKVWRVSTDPALTRHMGGEYVSDWKVGSSFGWKAADGTMVTHGTILKIEPEKFLQHTLFTSVGAIDSVIAYEFGENGHGTILHAQEDFSKSITDKEYADAMAGWDAALLGVKEIAERLE